VEVIARLLRSVEVPRNVIEQTLHGVRNETQTSERKQTLPRSQLAEVRALSEMKIESVLVQAGSRAAGASVVQLDLRSATGALAVGILRGDQLLPELDPHAPFEPGDVVYVVGTGKAIREALPLFDA
jgi:CPA2 family monovalent cation:H+ antiporter-2